MLKLDRSLPNNMPNKQKIWIAIYCCFAGLISSVGGAAAGGSIVSSLESSTRTITKIAGQVPARRGILQADGGGSTTSADGGEFRFIAQADETSPQQHHTDLVSSSGNVNGTSSPYSSEAAVELLLGVLKQQSSRDAVENARRRRIEEINNDILATLRKITSEMDTPQNTVLDTLALIMELQMERDNGESQQSEFVFEINNQIVRALDDQANSSPDTKEELPDATEQDHQQQHVASQEDIHTKSSSSGTSGVSSVVDAGDGIWEVQRLVHEAELREHVETERLEGLFNRSQEVLQELRRLPLKEPEVQEPENSSVDSAASLSDAIASAWRQQVETSEQRAAARLQEMGILNEAILSRLQQMYAGNQFRRRLRSEAALIPESMRSGRGTETAAEVPVKHASGPDSAASGQEEANSTETSASSKQNQCQRTSDMMERHDYVFGELLRTAIQSSGLLDDILDNSGIEFTLFAPTTNGLQQLASRLNMDVNKMVQNETLMRRVLEYHISPGILGPEDLVSTDDVPTLLGKDIQLTTRGRSVVITGANNNATIVNVMTESFPACNGTVYLVRQALVPPGLQEAEDKSFLRQRIMELENQLQLLQDGSTRDSQGPSAGTSREQQLLTALRDQVMNGNGSQKDRQQSSALMEEIRSLELSNKQESREPLPNQEAGPLNSSQPAAGGSGRLTYEEFTALVGGAQGSSGNEQGTPIQRVRETLTSIAQPSSRNSTRRGTNLPAFIAALLTADTGDESSLEESDMPPTRGSTESRNDGDVVSQAERALSTARAQAAESQGIEIPNLPPLLAVAGVLGNEETLGSINADVMQLMQAVIGGGPDTPRDEARARSASGTLADGRQPQDRRDGRFQLSFPAGQNDVSGSVLNPQIPGAAGGSIPGFPGASGIFPFTGMGGSFGGPGFPAGMGMAFPGQAAGFPAGGMGGMAMAGGLGGLPSGGMGFPGLG